MRKPDGKKFYYSHWLGSWRTSPVWRGFNDTLEQAEVADGAVIWWDDAPERLGK